MIIIRLVVATSDRTGDRIPIELVYDSSDPCTANLSFMPRSTEPVAWVLSRDLIQAGLDDPVGYDRAWIAPRLDTFPQMLAVCLVGMTGERDVFYLPRAEVRRWLETTYTAVPAGTEHLHLDIDGLLDELLTGSERES